VPGPRLLRRGTRPSAGVLDQPPDAGAATVAAVYKDRWVIGCFLSTCRTAPNL
jgi:hypothetical protein